MKKNMLRSVFNAFAMRAFAANKTTTAVVSGGDNVKFTDGVRMVYSKEIEFKALPNMRFMQFATVKTELGVTPGLTISMLTYDNLTLGGALTEMTQMVTQAMSGSTKQITVQEYGNAIGVSELLIQSSFDDIMASATTLLGRDYAMVLDCELRDTALSGTNVVYAAKSDGTKVTSRATLDATCVMKVSTIKDAIEILATNNAPKAVKEKVSKADAEDVIEIPRQVARNEIALFFYQIPDRTHETRVSIRTRGNWDATVLAGRFGGGGHKRAAGCTIKGAMAAAKRQMRKAVRDLLKG